jgi:flagellum-specific peptidoglycan hydrolase FlgJ
MVFAGETNERHVIERVLNIDPSESKKTINPEIFLPSETKISDTTAPTSENTKSEDKMNIDVTTTTTTNTTDGSKETEIKTEGQPLLEKQIAKQTNDNNIVTTPQTTSQPATVTATTTPMEVIALVDDQTPPNNSTNTQQQQQQSSTSIDSTHSATAPSASSSSASSDPSRKFDNDPSLNEPKFLETIQKNARTTLKRLELLADLGIAYTLS